MGCAHINSFRTFAIKSTYLNNHPNRYRKYLLGSIFKSVKRYKMKLTINYKTRASKVLNFTTEEVEEYAKRVKGHLNKCMSKNNTLTANQIIQSIFIIQDIQDKQIEKEAKELQIQNPIIRKYQHDIKLMNHSGLGANRISRELRVKHNINVSASTIYRYLRDNNHGES
jgi:hypothetical protein